MQAAGWRFGERYDPQRRTHPGLCAWAYLPAAQRATDELEALVIVDLLEAHTAGGVG